MKEQGMDLAKMHKAMEEADALDRPVDRIYTTKAIVDAVVAHGLSAGPSSKDVTGVRSVVLAGGVRLIVTKHPEIMAKLFNNFWGPERHAIAATEEGHADGR